MESLLRRRHLFSVLLGLATGLTAGRVAAAQPRLRETYYWQFTGVTNCSTTNFIEERWCYYECAAGVCTPLQYEWRQATRPC